MGSLGASRRTEGRRGGAHGFDALPLAFVRIQHVKYFVSSVPVYRCDLCLSTPCLSRLPPVFLNAVSPST